MHTKAGTPKCRATSSTRFRSLSPEGVGSVTATTASAFVIDAITGHPMPGAPSTKTHASPLRDPSRHCLTFVTSFPDPSAPTSSRACEKVPHSVASKQVWGQYKKVLSTGKDEFDVLINVDRSKVEEASDEGFADVIMRNRQGEIKVSPGYDGVYGVPETDKDVKLPEKSDQNLIRKKQMNLKDFFE